MKATKFEIEAVMRTVPYGILIDEEKKQVEILNRYYSHCGSKIQKSGLVMENPIPYHEKDVVNKIIEETKKDSGLFIGDDHGFFSVFLYKDGVNSFYNNDKERDNGAIKKYEERIETLGIILGIDIFEEFIGR